mgnify:CR=1 FL=1
MLLGVTVKLVVPPGATGCVTAGLTVPFAPMTGVTFSGVTNEAVMVVSLLSVTLQLEPVPAHPPPDQPAKMAPDGATA